MQAYKYTGTLDPEGRIIPSEPLSFAPGETFELVLWPIAFGKAEASGYAPLTPAVASTHKPKRVYRVRALRSLLEAAPPIPPDFDLEKARQEALQERYGL